MQMIPRGDYYVWHCDWCDSTNYTIWTRVDSEDLACAACHKRVAAAAESSPVFSRQQPLVNGSSNLFL